MVKLTLTDDQYCKVVQLMDWTIKFQSKQKSQVSQDFARRLTCFRQEFSLAEKEVF